MGGQEGGRWDVGIKENAVFLQRVSDGGERLFDDSLASDEARGLAELLTKYADKLDRSEDSGESDKSKDSDKSDKSEDSDKSEKSKDSDKSDKSEDSDKSDKSKDSDDSDESEDSKDSKDSDNN